MINILNDKPIKKIPNVDSFIFDGSYINKFDLALRNFEMFVREEAKRKFSKKRLR